MAELADYIEMPRTPSGDGRSSAARINVLIEEPGGGRLFVAEHAGPLSIVDKTTRKAVTYINFNGSADAPGLFPKFAPTGGFVSGLMGFAFDPDYRRNGVFYTIHLENPALTVDGKPKAGVLPGLDASRFVPTKPIGMPANGQTLTREAVISEWTDSNIKNVTFEGTVREVMRVQLLNAIHPTSDLTFNPAARQGDADWRVLYVSTGDGGTGERNDVSRLNPQRLDHFSGTIIRIVPDLRAHVSTSQVSENGQYRIPNDNPFVSTPGARKEIFAYGMRNPHRMAWDVGAGPGSQANLLAFVIGSNVGSPVRYETINIVRRGANYGYPLREGPEFKPESPIYWSPERRQHLTGANFRYGRARQTQFRCRTRHSPTRRVSRAWRSPTASSIAARGGLNFKGPLFLATSPADDCFTRGWRISLPPRTATPRRWRHTPRSRRRFAHLWRSASG